MESSIATLLSVVALSIALGLDTGRSGITTLALTASGSGSSSGSGRRTTSEGSDGTATTHHGSGTLQTSRALEGVGVHVHGRVVAGHHAGPVASVVGPGAGHTGGGRSHGTAGGRTVVEAGAAWSRGVVVVGRHAAVATHVVAVHGRRRRRGHDAGGRGHVSTGLLAKGTTVRGGAVRRGHDSRSGGGLSLNLLLVLLGEEALTGS